MKKYRLIAVTLIFGFVLVNQAFPQSVYRKPSNSDIEWLLGKPRTYHDVPAASPCEPICQSSLPSNQKQKSASTIITKPSEEITQISATLEVSDDFTEVFFQGDNLDEIVQASVKASVKTQDKPAPKLVPRITDSQPNSASKCIKPLEEPIEKTVPVCGSSNDCRRYNEGYEDCVTAKPLGFFFQLSGCRQFVGKQHGTCCCWRCTELDTPDMVGDAAWIPNRFVNLTSTGTSAVFSIPTAMSSRLNIAEHFNAEVRDRIWFDYRHLGNAMSLATDNFRQSQAVDQFTFGLETRLTTDLSVEFRVPIVNQFDSMQNNTPSNRDTELGNLSLIFKHILCRSEALTFAGGIGIVFPTAEDWRLPSLAASLRNKSYYLVPYLGFQWHPNEKTFGHFLVQADVPVSDNELRFNTERLAVKEPIAVRLGWQVGRWFYRNDLGSHTCRLGGFLELDYTITSSSGKFGGLTSDGDRVYLGSNTNKPQPVNLAVGLPILFGQFAITNAVIFPLTNNERQFSAGYDFSLSRRF